MHVKKSIAVLVGLMVVGSGCAASTESDEAVNVDSTQQALGETVAVNKTSYVFGEPVVISYAGLPGNPQDWVTIAPAGAANNVIREWRYTGGRVSGSISLAAPAPAGQYVARVFANNGFTLLAQSAPFTVTAAGAAATTTNKGLYTPSEPIVVSYKHLAGYANDWVAIARAGAPANSVLSWKYTGGGFSGSMSFPALPVGRYVARSFLNNGTLQAESATFDVVTGISVRPEKTAYYNDEVAQIHFIGLSDSGSDWIAIAPVGADAMGYRRWDYVSTAAGSQPMSLVALEGTFVPRAYLNDTFDVAYEGEPFTIQQRPMTSTNAGVATLSVTTDKASYRDNELAAITFGGMSGSQADWIAIAPAGSPPETFNRWIYTRGVVSGVQPFALGYLEGTFVVRAFFNDEFVVRAESAPFTVTKAP